MDEETLIGLYERAAHVRDWVDAQEDVAWRDQEIERLNIADDREAAERRDRARASAQVAVARARQAAFVRLGLTETEVEREMERLFSAAC